MRIIVCGGRDYADYDRVLSVLENAPKDRTIRFIPTVIHGAARGADSLADRAAKELGYFRIACPADWKKHGKAAGAIRNQEMLRHRPHLVIAFPGGRGTADMVRRARKAGIAVREIK